MRITLQKPEIILLDVRFAERFEKLIFEESRLYYTRKDIIMYVTSKTQC